MSTHFAREIDEQPACLARLLGERDRFIHVGAAVRAFGPRFVVTAARGSSDNAARYAKYLFGAHHRLVVSLGAPSLVTVYHASPSFAEALVLGISQSGQSPDVIALLAEAARQGALTIAITNAPESPLAAAARYVLPLQVGTESAVAATKSYTAELLALAMLSAAIDDHPQRWRELAQVPGAVEETLAARSSEALAELAQGLVRAERLFVLGRGFNFATAFELALKLKETAYLSAEAFSPPDLLHGPVAALDARLPGVVLAADGPTLADLLPLVDALAERHVPLIAITNLPAGSPSFPAALRRTACVPFSARLPEWLSPIAAIVPGQRLAAEAAELSGINPDLPRGLAKITRTT